MLSQAHERSSFHSCPSWSHISPRLNHRRVAHLAASGAAKRGTMASSIRATKSVSGETVQADSRAGMDPSRCLRSTEDFSLVLLPKCELRYDVKKGSENQIIATPQTLGWWAVLVVSNRMDREGSSTWAGNTSSVVG